MFVLRSLSLAPRCEARTLVSGNKPGGSERDFPGETRKIQHSTFFFSFLFLLLLLLFSCLLITLFLSGSQVFINVYY